MRRHQKFIFDLERRLEEFQKTSPRTNYMRGYLMALIWVGKQYKLPIADEIQLPEVKD